MNPRATALFAKALEIPAERRDAFLAEACGGDAELRLEVARLLTDKADADARFGGDTGDLAFTLAADGSGKCSSREAVPGRPLPATEKEGDVIGPYKLREQIGEGGFGTVWVAEQERPVRRYVALKIVKLGMDTKDVIARFEQERQALAMMDHPNIARVFDAGATDTGRPYFVMELVRGVKITDYCDEKELSTGERIRLFIIVCKAVQHAHQKGIIHRDLKPSNILVTVNDGVPVPKVIDFGVAKATQGRLAEHTIYTQFQQMIGTPLYMSPEQADMTSLDVDTRSDVYSLGVLLYELLTGRTPIDAATIRQAGLDEMRRIIREVDPLRPSLRLRTLAGEELTTTARRRHVEPARLPNALRGDLDWIVMKCLEKDRQRRYDTANGLALDLERHLRDEVVIARPPTTAYLAGRLIRRNKLLFGTISAVTFALLAGIVASTWQAVRATRAEQRARAESLRAGEAERRETRQRLEAETQESLARRWAYASDMLQCRQALGSDNLREARQLLNLWRPAEGREDLRGWEWRWLWQGCRSDALFEIGEHRKRVLKAAFVNGGESVVTFDNDGLVRSWGLDRREGETLQEASDRGGFYPNSGYLWISPDGKKIAAPGVEGDDCVVRIRDLSRGTVVRTISIGEERPTGITVSPDGTTLAAFLIDRGGAWFWDIESGERKAQRVELQPDYVKKLIPCYGAVRYSPDGGTVAVGGQWGHVRLLNVADWTDRGEFHIGGAVATLEFSPDGRFLACGSVFTDPRIFVWNVAKGERERVLSGHAGFVAGLDFSPDGSLLASASGDQTVKLWETGSWQERATLLGHTDEVWSVTFAPDGKRLISTGKDRRVQVWSASDLPQRGGTTPVKPGSGNRWLDRSEDGETLVLVNKEGRVELSGKRAAGVPEELGSNNVAAFWVGRDEIVVGSEAPFELKLWNLASGRVEIFPLGSVAGRGGYVYLPAAGTLAAVLPREKITEATVVRWDLRSRRLISSCEIPFRDFPQWISTPTRLRSSFSRDGARMAVNEGIVVKVHDSIRGEPLATISLPEGSHGIQGMALAPDGKELAVADRSKPEILLFDPESGARKRVVVGHNLVILALTYSMDGSRLLSSTIGSEPLKLWDTGIWREVGRLEPPSGSSFLNSWFLPDGASILTVDAIFDTSTARARLFRAPTWEEIDEIEGRMSPEEREEWRGRN